MAQRSKRCARQITNQASPLQAMSTRTNLTSDKPSKEFLLKANLVPDEASDMEVVWLFRVLKNLGIKKRSMWNEWQLLSNQRRGVLLQTSFKD